MFNYLPSNVIPWLIGFPIFIIFGLRGLQNYHRLHNPLSRLFAYCGFSAGIAFFFFSVPFMFNISQNVMIAVSIIGDLFLYVLFITQTYTLYYLELKERVSAQVIMLPFLVLALVGWLANCYGYIHNGVGIENGKFVYNLPPLSDYIQLIFLFIIIVVGILLLVRVRQQTSWRAKGGLIGIAALFILSGIGGALNVILSGDPNQSPYIKLSYLIGFILFAIIIITLRIMGNLKHRNH